MNLSPIYEGSPKDTNRLPVELACYDLLARAGITFLRVDHDCVETMEACQEIDTLLGVDMCKNLFLCNRQRTQFYLLLLPGDKPFRTAEFSKQVGSSRVGFAGEEDMVALLGLHPGSVSLLGLMNDTDHRVTLCVDAELLDQPYMGMHPCVNTSSLRMTTTDAFGPLLRAMDHEMTVVTLERRENHDAG